MSERMQLYLFGDQTFNFQPCLKELLDGRYNLALRDFVEKSYNAIRIEIYQLPPQERDGLCRFTSAEDLLSWDQSGRRCLPLDMAVACIYHLGSFIR